MRWAFEVVRSSEVVRTRCHSTDHKRPPIRLLTQLYAYLLAFFGASGVTTIWRYRNLFIIITIIVVIFIPQAVKIPGVKN